MTQVTEDSRPNCIIVDDEPLARRILERFVMVDARLRLVGTFARGLAALAFMEVSPVDLILLDVRMPDVSGPDLLRRLTHPPAVIISTAYSEYAVEGFDLHAVDYLLKPVGPQRFALAIERFLERFDHAPVRDRLRAKQTGERSEGAILLRVDRAFLRLCVQDITFVEARENYVRVHTSKRAYMSKGRISEMSRQLSEHGFLRVHRSYLVNPRHVARISGSTLEVAGRLLPFSRSARFLIRRVLVRPNLRAPSGPGDT